MARLKKAVKSGKGGAVAKTTLPTYKAVEIKTFVNTYYDLVPVGKHPDHKAYPKVNLERCPADNYYAVEPKFRKPMQMVTVLPDGLCLGWAHCGECKAWWVRCACTNGLSCPKSVEYIYDKHQAEAAGEEWNYLHPNYQGSLSRVAREKRQKALETRGRGGRSIPPATRPTETGSKRLRKRGATTTPEPPRKTLRKASTKRTDSSSVITERGVDSKALDAAAKGQATDLNKQVLAQAQGSANGSRPKKLKRRSK